MKYLHFFASVFTTVSLSAALETRTVSTGDGTVFGFKIDVPHVTKFLGIPYAETTAGQNRFKKPITKAPFTSPFNATVFGPACLQPDAKPNTVYSEDCLSLNVYVPGDTDVTPAEKLAVLIWVHGGAFKTGTSESYDPEVLVNLGQIIAVTINYRLAEFGFLATADKKLRGNFGLWDQQLAFQWVKNNIASFGGNPERITIAGESAGARCVTLQSLYAGSKGIFHRVIGESGSATGYVSVSRKTNAALLIKRLGCDAVNVDTVKCLRDQPVDKIETVINNKEYREEVDVVMRPVVDGEFLTETPVQILTGNNSVSGPARDFFAGLDMLTGCNNREGGYWIAFHWGPLLNVQNLSNFQLSRQVFENELVPIAINYSMTAVTPNAVEAVRKSIVQQYTDWTDPNSNALRRRNLLRMSSDFAQVSPAVHLARLHAGLTTKQSYLYHFTLKPNTHVIPTPDWLDGANHGDDLAFVFGEWIYRNDNSVVEAVISRAFVIMWTNFVKTGNPNTPLDVSQYINTTWPRFELTDQKYLDISGSMSAESVKERLGADSTEFWLDLLPDLLRQTTACPTEGSVSGTARLFSQRHTVTVLIGVVLTVIKLF